MAYTGQFGTINSQFGNIELAESGVPVTSAAGSNTLTFSQSAVCNVFPAGVATNTLTINQSVTVRLADLQVLSQTLTMSQLARGFNGTKIVGQSLTMSQLATAAKVYSRATSETITFSQLSEVEKLTLASNTITFSDSTDVDVYFGTNDTITFTQTLTSQYNPHTEFVFQTLTLTQTVLSPRVLTLSVSQTFTISQAATGNRVKTASASNFLNVHDDAVAVQLLLPSNTITFTDDVDQFRIIRRSLSSTLALSQAVVVHSVLRRTLTDTLTFRHTHDKLIPNGQVITVQDAVATLTSNVVIFQVAQQAITFKKPLLNDTEGGLSQIVKQYSVNGQLYTYARKVVNRKLKYTFEISRAKAEETRQYIISNLSQPMKMQNWKGEIWWGVITNNPFPIRSTKRSVPCNNEDFEITVEFEGVRIH